MTHHIKFVATRKKQNTPISRSSIWTVKQIPLLAQCFDHGEIKLFGFWLPYNSFNLAGNLTISIAVRCYKSLLIWSLRQSKWIVWQPSFCIWNDMNMIQCKSMGMWELVGSQGSKFNATQESKQKICWRPLQFQEARTPFSWVLWSIRW